MINPRANKAGGVDEGCDLTPFAEGLRFRTLMPGSPIDAGVKSSRAAHPHIQIDKDCLTRELGDLRNRPPGIADMVNDPLHLWSAGQRIDGAITSTTGVFNVNVMAVSDGI